MMISSRSSAAGASPSRGRDDEQRDGREVGHHLLVLAFEARRRVRRAARAPRGRSRGDPPGSRTGRAPAGGDSCRFPAREKEHVVGCSTKCAVASSSTGARFFFLLKSRSKLSRVLPSCLIRRPSNDPDVEAARRRRARTRSRGEVGARRRRLGCGP